MGLKRTGKEQMAAEPALSRRERQILDVVFARGKATVSQLMEDLPEEMSRSAARTFLRILEDKGHVKHTSSGREFVYQAMQSTGKAGRSAVARVLNTFFSGSLETALATYLAGPNANISDDELKRIEKLVRKAQQEGR